MECGDNTTDFCAKLFLCYEALYGVKRKLKFLQDWLKIGDIYSYLTCQESFNK
jgi:hypothetical protein